MSTVGLIPIADLNTQIDYLGIAYRKLAGTSASGFGMAEPGAAFGAAAALTSLVASIYGSNNEDEADGMGLSARAVQAAMSAKAVLGGVASDLIVNYGRHATKFAPDVSVNSLDSLLTWWNTGTVTKWQALQDSVFYDIFLAARKVAPQPWNLYQEILQGTFTDGNDHLYTNGLGKFVVTSAGVGTFTAPVLQGALINDGSGNGKIDSGKFAGGFPQARVSGLAGSGTLTVTATIFDPATKAVQTGKTLTFNITANGVNNTVTGGTAPAGALIIVTTSIAIAAGITAGTIYIEGARPAGRPLVA